MSAWLEREWERLGGGALIFLPFTILYGIVTWARRMLYRIGVLRTWRSPVCLTAPGMRCRWAWPTAARSLI